MKKLIASFVVVLSLISSSAHAQLTNGLVAYYPFNGNAIDQSGNGRTATVIGATLTTDRFGNSNSAYAVDGNYIIRTNIPVNLSGSYTFSAWFDLLLYQEGMEIFELSSGSLCNANPVLFEYNSSVSVNHCGASASLLFDSPTNLTGNWRHFTMTVNSNLTKIYRDGVLISTTTEAWPATSAITMTLGASRNGIGQFSKCAFDDVRVYNRALSSNEVAQLYASEAPPVPDLPLTTGLAAFYPFNGNANDESGNGRNGTVSNATLTLNRFGTPDSAYYFSNALIIATNIQVNLSGPYTYSAWIGLNEFQDGRALFELSLDATTCNANPQMYQTASSVFYSPCGNGQTGLNFFGTESDLTNQWRHLVVTVNGGITKIYRDGVLLSSTAENWPSTTAIMLTLGSARGGFNFFGNQNSLCALDDIRLYNRALSSNEVAQLHALESQPSCADTVSLLQGRVAELQTQLAATNDIVSSLQAQLAASAANVQALETELTAVDQSLQRLSGEFQITFKNPQFEIPGATTPAKVNNLVISVEKLNKGNQQSVYNNLGGAK